MGYVFKILSGVRTTVPPSVIYISLSLMGAKSFCSLENCLPEQTVKIIPLSISLLITVIYSGSIMRVPSLTRVPSISVAINLIIYNKTSFL